VLACDGDAVRLVLGLGLAAFDRVSIPYQFFGARSVDVPAMGLDQERLHAPDAEGVRATAKDLSSGAATQPGGFRLC
jgi:hypothetical protein